MRERVSTFSYFVLALILYVGPSLAYADETSKILEILNSGEDIDLNVKKLIAESFTDKARYLDLSYVEPDDEDLDAGWNAKYNFSYSKSNANGFSAESERFALDAYSAELDIKGSYSFYDAANTDDLSSVTVSLAYLNVDLGKLNRISESESKALQRCFQAVKFPRPEDFETDGDLDMVAFEAAADEAEKLNNECRSKHLPKRLENPEKSRSYSVDLHALVEGNQDYSSKNVAFGIQGLYSVKGLPSVRIDIERVDASENEDRGAITSEDEFDRVSGEIGYQYRFGGKKDGLPFNLYLSYRFFHEISAPREIKDADLETFDYVALSLRFSASKFGLLESQDPNFYLRYTDGQLPFDREEDRALEFGFSTNIEALKALLQ